MKLTDFITELNKIPDGTKLSLSFELRKLIYSCGKLDALSSQIDTCNAIIIDNGNVTNVEDLKAKLQKLADTKPNTLVYVYVNTIRYVPKFKIAVTCEASDQTLFDYIKDSSLNDDAIIALVEKCNKEMKFSNDAFLEVFRPAVSGNILPLHFTFLDNKWYIGDSSSICPTEFSVPVEIKDKLVTKTTHYNITLHRYRVMKDFLRRNFPASVANRIDDLLKETTFVDENGRLNCTEGDTEVQYIQNSDGKRVRDGVVKYYCTTAQGNRYMCREETYVLGCLHGLTRIFNDKGDVVETVTYKNGKLHGEYTRVMDKNPSYPEGTKMQTFYDDDERHGEKTYTLPCGFVKTIMHYKHGQLDDTTDYENDGSKVIKLYKNSRLVDEKHYNSTGRLVKSLVWDSAGNYIGWSEDEMMVVLSTGKKLKYQRVGERLVVVDTMTEEEKKEVKAAGYSYVEV